MIDGLYERVAKEQAATDAGRVYEEHGKLRQRFRHADLCPNFRRSERYFDAWLRRVVQGAEVLDLGCNEGVHAALLSYGAPAPCRSGYFPRGH